jgi:two-component system, OmpR family, sensor kinase
VSRIPLRVRLALAFAVAMAVVLAVMGSLLYVRLGDSLLEQVDEGLERSAESTARFVRAARNDEDVGFLQDSGEEAFAQLLGPGERVRGLSGGPLITSEERGRSSIDAYFLTLASAPNLDGEPARLHVRNVDAEAGTLTLVVGASLEDRQEALDGLLAQLLVVGPLALGLASLGGYFLAGAALRPVEAMRRGAEEISSERADQRLPLPPANDEIRRLGATLNDMLARLEAGIARERRFVADASHELRTPLATLRTELELALRRPREPNELEDALRSATAEVERVVRLAEDLLVLARADEGRLPLDTSSHVVRELLDAVAGRYDARARAAARAIEVAAQDDWICTGDRLRLEQALGNLVDNALRHGAGTIKLEAALAGDLVELRVSDEGTGFPPDFLPHAFERFSRADVARAEGGSGLGLAIVDAVARAHGGSASAANLPSGGAAITLTVPGATLAEPHLALI